MTTFEGSISLTISICSMSMEAPESSNNSLILFFTQHTHTHTHTHHAGDESTGDSAVVRRRSRSQKTLYDLYTLYPRRRWP
jgi:hypothetical protein